MGDLAGMVLVELLQCRCSKKIACGDLLNLKRSREVKSFVLSCGRGGERLDYI